MKFKVDEDTKKKFLEGHFFYEVTQMIICMQKVLEKNPDKSKISIENYIAVAFSTHARNLWEFFYDKNDKNGHKPRVWHYIPNWDINASPEISKWYGIINKGLSHLDYRRVNNVDPPAVAFIYPAYEHFTKLITIFLNNLSKDYIGPNLTKLLETK
jgi:hypothetical protein